MSGDKVRLGARVRALRKSGNLTQAKLAEKLGISASYLNLIENGRRPLSADLLIKLAQSFRLDLKDLAGEDEVQVVADLLELFGDPMFEPYSLTSQDVRMLAAQSPAIGRAVVAMYHALQGARSSAQSLAERLSEGAEWTSIDSFRLPSEEVSELIQRHSNYFAALEAGAERLWRDCGPDRADLYPALARYFQERLGGTVRVERVQAMRGAVRRYDPESRELLLSEVLRRGSRNFQLAHQIGLLTEAETLERLSQDPILTTAESRALARVALANYYAAAVLMPYEPFLKAAKAERYDIELLGHRFRTSFEQICHRLTTLRRPGLEGIPLHLIRVDGAGNISKRFSASGVRIARFSGTCPRWILHSAFLTPGMYRVQVSKLVDGTSYFSVARTLPKDGGGYHTLHTVQAIELGCPLQFAREMVYSDGVDLENPAAAKAVGVTCRTCEWLDCEQRVLPALQAPLRVDENVRGIALYAPVSE